MEHSISLGETIRIHVIANSEQGLPEAFTPDSIVPIDVMSHRPINVDFSEDAVSLDLCFGTTGPQRCTFKWEDIVAVSAIEGNKTYLKVCQTTIRYIITTDEDNWLHLIEIPHKGLELSEELMKQNDKSEPKKPGLHLVK